jgi:hypothetical protein
MTCARAMYGLLQRIKTEFGVRQTVASCVPGMFGSSDENGHR